MTIYVIESNPFNRDWTVEAALPEDTLKTIEYLPVAGQKIRLEDISNWMGEERIMNCWEVVDVLHDWREKENVEIYVLVKPYTY